MALSAPSKNVAAFDKGRLAAGISATATTITVSPIFKTVNGVRTKQGFDSTSGECLISFGGFEERISFEGKSVDSTTKITTLTGCTRGLPTTNITADFSAGTGKVWAKGAAIVVIDSASYNQSSVFVNTDNAFTGANTFAGTSTFNAPVIVTGATSYVKLPELTTTQRDALTASEGMLIKNSTTGTNQQYVGGAWVDIGDTGTSNASTTVAGKVEEATAAEIGASTAAGATGARLFINPSSVAKTSSGAGDENKLPVLGANGKLASGFLPQGEGIDFFGDGSDGSVTLTGDTTITKDMNYLNLNLSTFTLNTGGYRVKVRGELSGSGKIKAPTGGAGSNGTTGGSGGAGGAAATAVSVPANLAGGAGGAGGNVGAGAAGTNGQNITNSVAATLGGNGAAGGSSGLGQAGGAGGTAGTSSAYGSTLTAKDAFFWAVISSGVVTNLKGGSGAAGGGGGGSNGTAGGSGGGGGGGGGNLCVFAYLVTGTFTFESIGGAGGNGGNGGAAQEGGGGGGGGGGAGGMALFGYYDKTGWSGSFVLTGGAGGTGGSKSSGAGSASNGSNGSNGASGTAIQIQYGS